MIVKNEAPHIESCLAAIKDLAQEILIGDTGSTDQTLTLARSLGARVFELPWHNDFAEARNAVLAHATTDWVMSLDADCFVPPHTQSQIPPLLKQPLFQGPVVLNAKVLSAQHVPIFSRFLFPQGYGLRFQGRIHETIVGPPDLRQYHCPQIEIEHRACPEHVYQAKHKWYVQLLQEELQSICLSPAEKMRLWKHLGDSLNVLGQQEKAYEAFLTAWELLHAFKATSPKDPFYHYLAHQLNMPLEVQVKPEKKP